MFKHLFAYTSFEKKNINQRTSKKSWVLYLSKECLPYLYLKTSHGFRLVEQHQNYLFSQHDQNPGSRTEATVAIDQRPNAWGFTKSWHHYVGKKQWEKYIMIRNQIKHPLISHLLQIEKSPKLLGRPLLAGPSMFFAISSQSLAWQKRGRNTTRG